MRRVTAAMQAGSQIVVDGADDDAYDHLQPETREQHNLECWSLTFLTTDLDSHGGASRLLCTLARQFLRAGHDVAVFTVFPPPSDNQYAAALLASGVPLNPGLHPRRPVVDLGAFLRPFARVLKRVHGAISHAPLTVDVPVEERAARFLLRPWLERAAIAAVRRRIAVAAATGRASVVQVHRGERVLHRATELDCHLVYLENSSPQRGLGIDWWWDGIAARLCNIDLVVVGSEAAAGAVRDYFAFPGAVRVLPWMVEDAAEPRPQRTPSIPVIGTAGRLHPEKGQDLLIRALPRILTARPAALWVAGDGPCREALALRATELGVEGSTVFLGALDPEAMIAFWSKIDVLVLPSQIEGTPLVALEAMARGIPVVATDVGGMRELLGDSQAGVLVPPEDERAIAEAVLALLADPGRCRELAGAGIEVLLSRHSPSSAMPVWIDAYRQLIATARRSSSGKR